MKRWICVALLATTNSIATTIGIVWPFNPAGTQANYVRIIEDQANRIQSHYVFTLESRPGAGGVIAAQTVLHNDNKLLSTPSSFFLRPIFYPNESYRVQDFKPVLLECTGLPYAVVSKRYHNLVELQQQRYLSIGVIAGHPTELIARQLQRLLPNTVLTIVNYNNTSRPTLDVLSDVLDLNVDLASSAVPWIQENKLFNIGASGVKDNPYFRTFHSQHVTGFENLVSNYYILARADDDVDEITQILTTANRVNNVYNTDYCQAANLSPKQTLEFYNTELKFWNEYLK